MRRISGMIRGQEVVFDPAALKHLKVLRLRFGEPLEILTSDGVYAAFVSGLDPLAVTLAEKLGFSRELPIDLSVFIPLLKNGNFEFCLQKAVELGATRLIPYCSKRTVVKVSEGDFKRKTDRYLRIISEAAEQSNRDVIPSIAPLWTLGTGIPLKLEHKFFPYEGESLNGKLFSRATRFERGASVGLIIGPEGGFESAEVAELKSEGFLELSLGRRILRAETALVSALSLIGYFAEVE